MHVFFTTIERVGFYKQASVGRLEWLFQQAVPFEDESMAGFFSNGFLSLPQRKTHGIAMWKDVILGRRYYNQHEFLPDKRVLGPSLGEPVGVPLACET